MKLPKSELLSIDEIAALIGKTIEETKKILETANIPVADRDGEYNLYDPNIISEYIIKNSDVMFK